MDDLLQAESGVCDSHRQLYSCMLAEDYGGANRNITALNARKKNKKNLYANLASRAREVGGPAVDTYVIQGIKEAAKETRPQ